MEPDVGNLWDILGLRHELVNQGWSAADALEETLRVSPPDETAARLLRTTESTAQVADAMYMSDDNELLEVRDRWLNMTRP